MHREYFALKGLSDLVNTIKQLHANWIGQHHRGQLPCLDAATLDNLNW